MFFALFSAISYGQLYEYNVVNLLSENSYYYTEARKIENSGSVNLAKIVKRIEENDSVEIYVLNSKNYAPVSCFVLFNGYESDSVRVFTTDSAGHICIPIKLLPKRETITDFEIKTIFNGLYNGIIGTFDVYLTERITIILGKQGYENITIKSENPIAPLRIMQLLDSIKRGCMPEKESGLYVDVSVKL